MTKHISRILLFVLTFTLFNVSPLSTDAAYVQNNTNGTYTDDFANATGLSNYHGYAGSAPVMPTATYSKVDTGSGTVKLTNSSGNFAAPYQTSGYVITKDIMPLSVSKWGTFSFVGNTPANTSIKVQVLDSGNGLFNEEQLPGNAAGFTAASIDLQSLAVLSFAKATHPVGGDAKVARLRFKITLITTDTAVTPSIDAISFNWTPKAANPPVASTLNDSGWPTDTFDNQGTNHTDYNTLGYPVIKWKSDDFAGNFMTFSGEIYQNSFINVAFNDDFNMYWVDKDSGDITRKLEMLSPLLYSSTIDKNGIMYSNEYLSDIATAVDLNTGEIKWTYAFGGGHGNNQMLIGKDGTIFTIYSTGDPNAGVITLYAFNPNGTIKFTKAIDVADDWSVSAGYMSMNNDGNLFFGTRTYDSDYLDTNGGKLYAISPNDGTVLWSYNTGNLFYGAPVIDTNGNIYVGQSTWDPPILPQKMYSISPSGGLNWERSINQPFTGWTSISLDESGNLVASKLLFDDYIDGTSYLETINTIDGSLINEIETGFFWRQLTDNSSNTIFRSGKYEGGLYSPDTISSYDVNLDLNWEMFTSPASTEGDVYATYRLSTPIQDDRGWIYAGLGKSVYDTTTYESYPDQQYANFFALAPWTITSSVANAGNLSVGDALVFNATTSMLQTNLLTGGDNQMQVVLEDGTKLPMTYVETNSNGDTVWTASTTLTSGMLGKTNNYTIEANADSVTTKMAVSFDTPETNSGNTGFKVAGTFVPDNQNPTFTNLPGTTSPINIVDGQVITQNPYIIRVKPTDNVGILKVEFYIDNVLIGTDYEADSDGIYEYPWDTSKYHSDVKVIAYDTSGNTVTLNRSATVRLASATTLPETGGSNNGGSIPWFLAGYVPKGLKDKYLVEAYE